MKELKAGKFTATVSDPYPVWVEIRDTDGGRMILSHSEILDLSYVVDRAMSHCRYALPDSQKPEVD